MLPLLPLAATPLLLGALVFAHRRHAWRRWGFPLGLVTTWWVAEGVAWSLWPIPGPPPADPTPPPGAPFHVTVAPDMLRPPPALGQLSLVFVGDALTAGVGVPLTDAFPQRVARHLTATHPGLQVLNHGVEGDDLHQQLLRIPLLEHADAHDAIVWIYRPGALTPAEPPPADLVRYPPPVDAPWSAIVGALRHRQLVEKERERRLRDHASRHGVDFNRTMLPRLLSQIHATRERGALTLFAFLPDVDALDAEETATIREQILPELEAAGAPTLDLGEALSLLPPESRRLHPRLLHLSPAAHAAVAKAIAQALLARDLPRSIAPACQPPSLLPDPWKGVDLRRCADPTPRGLLHAAEQLAEHIPASPAVPVDTRRLAASLAHIAAARAKADPGLRDQAVQLRERLAPDQEPAP